MTCQRGAALLAAPLLRPEEEDSVLDNRAAEIAAEVLVLQLPFRLTSGIKEEIVCVETVTAQEIEASAMKLIAAAFRDQIDDGALCLTVLCAEAVAFDFELCNGINRRKHQKRGVRTDVHIVNAVNS